jgi:predicted aldo/keto reductase-like oxidoreductase
MGKFIGKYPELRKKLFIATRAWLSRKPQDMEKLMRQSMERMQTDYFDLYYGIHRLKEPETELNDDVKQWVKKMKKQGAFRLFGCTTHGNMAESLLGAARHDWIDVIMFRYNFRTTQDPKLQAGIEACHKAGIALVAMKTQGIGIKDHTDKDKKLIEHFSAKGFTQGQAKIKCALNNERFSTACVGMVTVSVLKENVDAVIDKTKLTQQDLIVT